MWCRALNGKSVKDNIMNRDNAGRLNPMFLSELHAAMGTLKGCELGEHLEADREQAELLPAMFLALRARTRRFGMTT